MTSLSDLQTRLGYHFRDTALLTEALTHPSYLPDHPEVTLSNQRLEFLGDAVLHLVLTDALFALYPLEREGALSKRRAALTKGVFLTGLARRLGIDEHLRLSAGEESTGGRSRAAALEDALEAVIGAIYRDSDLATVRARILAWYGPLSTRLANVEQEENPKGRLQEKIQPTHGNTALRYEVVATQGKDHQRIYDVVVFLNDRAIGQGRGTSKKTAEEAAAREGLDSLEEGAGNTPSKTPD
ncbi:MAG TPA: ribonuclease III [Opitutaceae bacterium]|nr:ribonuclease III [Opitutaceae bacterium]